MKYNNLGLSNLNVSQICLGTMTFGNPVIKKDAIEMVHWALDNGINFFDTADIYQGYDRHAESKGGVSESILGEAFQGKREKAIITTKVGNSIGGEYIGTGLGRKHIEHQINQSLKRLKTDYIDIYEMHRPDENTPIAESIEVFVELIKQGKIRYWGVSNFIGIEISEILKSCQLNNWEKPIVSQSPYSWLNRNIEEDLLPILESNNISLTPYRILEGGLLTGKYNQKNHEKENRLKSQPNWVSPFDERTLTTIEKFMLEADEMDLSPTQYSGHWLLSKSVISSIVVGARTIDQIKPFLK